MLWHLYFIMWVSGGGKGTLRRNLEKQNIENLEFLKSYVSREMRPGEIDGDIYHFISSEQFKKSIANDEFLEYEIVHKVAYYGTKKSDVDTGLTEWKILFKEIDTKGLKQLAEKHPEYRKNYTSFFLDVPNEEMERRFYERNPDGNPEDIANRIKSTEHEREQAKKYCDYIIDATKSPEQVLEKVLEVIKD